MLCDVTGYQVTIVFFVVLVNGDGDGRARYDLFIFIH
jgi:hypothetical protein